MRKQLIVSRITRVFWAVSLLIVSNLAIAAEAARVVEFNREELVMMAVEGQVSPPGINEQVYRVNADGEAQVFPGTGSITYNFRTGDSAVNLASNHVEPAVSLHNLGSSNDRDSRESRALNALSNIGNEAIVISGDAKGAKGAVVGKHGGAEHVMVDFPSDAVYSKLAIGDRIQIRAYGTGMRLENVAGVKVMNTSPALLAALLDAGMTLTETGKLSVPVTHFVPAKIMGSGLGRSHVYTGDYDIQFFDPATVAEYNLATLRFGDIVAVIDADHSYGRVYRQGAVSVAVVSHGRSDSAGHGPGVTTLFTSKDGNIEPFLAAETNLARLLKIRRLK